MGGNFNNQLIISVIYQAVMSDTLCFQRLKCEDPFFFFNRCKLNIFEFWDSSLDKANKLKMCSGNLCLAFSINFSHFTD